MRRKTELKNLVDFFIQGEFYCSRQPSTQLHDYDSCSWYNGKTALLVGAECPGCRRIP